MEIGVAEIEKPELKAGEVLVRIKYVGFCGSDLNTYLGRNPMVKMPVVPGHEVGAVIEEVGSEVPAELMDNPDICRNEGGSPTTYQMYGTGAVTLTFGNHTDNSVTGSVEVTIDGSTFHSLAWIPYYEGGIYSDENIITASNLQIYGNSSHTVTLSPTPNNGTLFGLEWTSDHEGLIDCSACASSEEKQVISTGESG